MNGRAYILKDRVHDLDRLLRAIRAVVAGDSFVDEEIVDALVRSSARLADGPIDALTDREREVLAEVATGASNATIAESLDVSAHAVEKHINSIFSKLGLSDGRTANRRVQAVLVHLRSQQRGPYPRPPDAERTDPAPAPPDGDRAVTADPSRLRTFLVADAVLAAGSVAFILVVWKTVVPSRCYCCSP